MDRRGIISAGTWLVDNVKIIEQYPARGNLTTITRVETGLGGCSHNVLADLAGLGLRRRITAVRRRLHRPGTPSAAT